MTITYTAFDGKKFDTYSDCAEYEANLIDKRPMNIANFTVAKRDIVKAFSNIGCNKCPFETECKNLRSSTRAHSTDEICLCDVIKNNIVNENYF